MKREFEGIAAFEPTDKKNMEKSKGSSMTIPHNGIDVALIMERANKGLPIGNYPDALESGQDDDFNSDVVAYREFSDEFDILEQRIAALQAYTDELRAKQTEHSESAASEQSTVKSPENG